MIEPYWNKEHTKYAVLITEGYGVGWSTSNAPTVAYDSRVVEYVMRHVGTEGWKESFDFLYGGVSRDFYERPTVKEFDEFLASIGYKGCYLNPISRIQIVWIDSGRKWCINEDDRGHDNLEFEDQMTWNSFT